MNKYEMSETEQIEWYGKIPQVKVAVTLEPPRTIFDNLKLLQSLYADVESFLNSTFVYAYRSRPPQLGAGPSVNAVVEFLLQHKDVLLAWLSKLGLLYRITRSFFHFVTRKYRKLRDRREASRRARLKQSLVLRFRIEDENAQDPESLGVEYAAHLIQDFLLLIPELQKILEVKYAQFNTRIVLGIRGGITVALAAERITPRVVEKIVKMVAKNKADQAFALERFGPWLRVKKVAPSLRYWI